MDIDVDLASTTAAEQPHSRRRRASTRRPIGAAPFLLGAVLVWAALVGGSLVAVYLFVVDDTPEVLAFRDVNIELSDYEITPDVIEIEPSTALTFLVSNVGDAQHNLQVTNEQGTARLKPGETASLDAGVAKESYLVWCAVKGHRELGMEARIVIKSGD